MSSTNYTKSLRKAISMLKCFSPSQSQLSAKQIAQKIGVHISTAYRMLATMSKEGLIEQDDTIGKYKIGRELYFLGNLYLDSTDIIQASRRIVEELNDMTGNVVSVVVYDHGYVTIVIREESKATFRWPAHIGSIFPAHVTCTGKLFLSELSEAEIDNIYPSEELLQRTAKTIAKKTQLKQELKDIRKQGVAFDIEGSYEKVCGVASLIRNKEGKGVAALTIAAPVFEINDDKLEKLAILVKMGSNLISHRMGYQNIAEPVHDIQEIRLWWERNMPDGSQKIAFVQANVK